MKKLFEEERDLNIFQMEILCLFRCQMEMFKGSSGGSEIY